VENLDEILQMADGVMVARGDLGLEMPLEQLPRIQRTILARARSADRPVILATQVLESMRSEPRPTRAEVSDAANAVPSTPAGARPCRAASAGPASSNGWRSTGRCLRQDPSKVLPLS
jgi:hypothetical protein